MKLPDLKNTQYDANLEYEHHDSFLSSYKNKTLQYFDCF